MTGYPMMCSSALPAVDGLRALLSTQVRRTAPRSELAKIMEQLVVKVRAFQDLSPEELAAPAYAGVIEGMNKRFSPRLDIGGATLAASGGDRRAARRLKKLVVSV